MRGLVRGAKLDRSARLAYHRRRGVGPGDEAKMGDGGLEAVLSANRPALRRFLRARGGTDADPDDLLQDLWLKLQTVEPSGPIAEPLAYLYRIADNMMHDRRRTARRRERRETDWAGLSAATLPEASTAPSAERLVLARDELLRMEAALAALGDRTSTILRRFRLDGHGQKAIAAEFGISLSAVEKHLQRAYRALVAARAGEAIAESGTPRRLESGTVTDAAS